MSKALPSLEQQAVYLARHFVGETPSDAIINRYVAITRAQSDQGLSSREARLLEFGFSHSALLPMLDAGLALLRPSSELRHRIYIMFAILEATPEYSHKFLAKQQNPLYIVVIGVVGIRAILRAIGGIMLIKALRI